MTSNLKKPRVILALTGSVQSEVAPRLISNLLNHPEMTKIELNVCATPSSLQFFERAEVERVLGKKIFVNHSDATPEFTVPHINLAEWADLILVYPASANTIAKCASGISDTLITTLVLSARCPVFFGPSMNDLMYEHPATQANLEKLEEYGYELIPRKMADVLVHSTGKLTQKMYCTESMVLAVVEHCFPKISEGESK